ncbi:Kinesin-like protein kif21b [Thoreauomyces humboldtii]|nr:Kinesin-like protein kif21b [Thoreauomyces humboldtii]
MASTSVKVALRVRPLSPKEVLASAQECVTCMSPGVPQVSISPPLASSSSFADSAGSQARSFTFDHVFDALSSQEEVYEDCVGPLVERFLEGFNATVLAYGQTGSGKTHSMGTGLESVAEPGSEGIVPRAIYYLFDKLSAQASASQDGFKFDVSVSFLELYNEEIVDLLIPRAKDGSAATNPNALSIREDGTGKIRWYGIKELPVPSPEELLAALEKGSLCRTTGSTDMNASSSRSHAIFSVILKQQKYVPPGGVSSSGEDTAAQQAAASELPPMETAAAAADPISHPGGSYTTLISKFHFVDLAGSERLKRTNAEGDRKKEGISINQGLLALGNVISALGDDTRRSANSHVPYRDSKLTRMLQDSLGGNSQTLMLACVSPSDTNYAETLNTLNYANRARNIKNKVVINQEWAGGNNANSIAMEREIRMLRATVSQLRAEMQLEGGSRPASGSVNHGSGDPSAAGYLSSQRLLVSGNVRDRDAQLRMQRERDLESEVDDLRRERDATRFENERLKFRCFRLQDRCRQLGRDLTDAIVRRDEVVVAYSQTLVPGRKRKGGPTRSDDGTGIKVRKVCEVTSRRTSRTTQDVQQNKDETKLTGNEAMEGDDEVISNSRDGSEEEEDERTISRRQVAAHPIIQSYARSIADLQFRLSEAEDKVTWYNDVVARLGGKGRNGKSAFSAPSRGGVDGGGLWTEDEIGSDAADMAADVELGIPSYPISQQLAEVEAAEEPADFAEAAGEKRVMEAIANGLGPPEDPELDNETERTFNGPKVYGVPSAMSVVYEPSTLFSSEDPTEDTVNPTDESGEDMFSVIAKIQSDIAEHEKLVSRIQHRDAEYETMRTAYEQKMKDLQTQLMQSKKERDLALQRMQDGGRKEEKKGTVAIKQRYEEKRKQLERQIDDFKRKLADTSRTRDERRGKDEGLMRGLKDTINSMKVEKSRMVKDLKKERERARSLEMTSKREIANLRRKEKKAVDLVKKLEIKSQIQLQRVLAQRRTDSDIKNRNSVMKILKRTVTPHRISKAGTSSGSASPKRRSNSHGAWKITTTADSRPATATTGRRAVSGNSKLSARSSPDSKIASEVDLDGSLNVRAALRKEMLDKELESCVAVRRSQKQLESLKAPMAKLVGEQKVLLDEREKVVRAEEDRTGRYEPEAWQYMDGRLAELDQAIGTIGTQIAEAERALRRARLAGESPPPPSALSARRPLAEVDLGWDNAVNLLRSVDPFELEAVAELYLDEVVALRHALEEGNAKGRERHSLLKEKEAVIVDLTASIKAGEALWKKRVDEARGEALNVDGSSQERITSHPAASEASITASTIEAPSLKERASPRRPKKEAWSDVVRNMALKMDFMDAAQEAESVDLPDSTSIAEPSVSSGSVTQASSRTAGPSSREVQAAGRPPPAPIPEPKAFVSKAATLQPPPPPKKDTMFLGVDRPPEAKNMSFIDRLALLGGGELARKFGGRSSADDGKENRPSLGDSQSSSSPPSASPTHRPASTRTSPQIRTPPRGRGQLGVDCSAPGAHSPRSVSVSPTARCLAPDDFPVSPTDAAADRRRRSPSWTYGRDLPRSRPASTTTRPSGPDRTSLGSSPSTSPQKRQLLNPPAGATVPPFSFSSQTSNPHPFTNVGNGAGSSTTSLELPLDQQHHQQHHQQQQQQQQQQQSQPSALQRALGSDVFERLAHSHTMASQAKVISRGMESGNALVPAATNSANVSAAQLPGLDDGETFLPAANKPRRKISGEES